MAHNKPIEKDINELLILLLKFKRNRTLSEREFKRIIECIKYLDIHIKVVLGI